MEEYLVDALGEEFHFTSEKQLRDFVFSEIKFWTASLMTPVQPEINMLAPHRAGKLMIAVNALEVFEGLKQALSPPPPDSWDLEVFYDLNEIKSELRAKWIYSNSSAAARCLDIATKSRDNSNSFYKTLISKDDTLTTNIGQHLAYEFISDKFQLTSRTQLELEIGEEQIKHLRSSINKVASLKERLFTGTKAHAEYLSSISNKQNEEHTARATELEELYEEKLRLKAPAKYWKSKAKRHRKRGLKAIILLISLLVGSAASLYYLFLTWLSGSSTFIPISLESFEGVLLFIALISTLAFLSRILSRITFSEFHLQRDAEERLQLTHLYLSLSDETSLRDDARIIILQSLFSRAETGLLINETGPTMPGITDLLGALKKT